MSSSGRRDADGRSYRAIPETLRKPLESSAKQSVVDPAIPGRRNKPETIKEKKNTIITLFVKEIYS